ncbi:formyl transferase [Paraglaciecola aestuariivivens]
MNILILSNKDLASNYALNLLVPQLAEQHQLHLWLSAKVGGKKALAAPLSRLKFFEQNMFNQLLSPLLSNTPQAKFTGFEGLQGYLSSTLLEENAINSPEAMARLENIAPDLIICIRFGGILKQPCIDIPPLGVLNLHSGILPDYRGVMATFWALLNGEKQIGTTLHTIDDASIDTGKVVKISRMKVSPNQSYLCHVLALYNQGVQDLIDAVCTLNANQALPLNTQPKTDKYYSFPNEQDLAKFAQNGLSLVDESAYLAFLVQHYGLVESG